MGRPKQDKTKQPGYAEKIAHLVEVQKHGKTIDHNDNNQVEQAVEWYFNKCQEDDLPVTVEGIAMSIGCTRQSINNWERGDRPKSSEVVSTLKKAKEIVAGIRMLDLHTGTGNPIGLIFDLTNNHGYEREANNSGSQLTINVSMTPQQLEDKYNTIIDGDYQEVQEPKLLPPEE